jgi:hypothetical protein
MYTPTLSRYRRYYTSAVQKRNPAHALRVRRSPGSEWEEDAGASRFDRNKARYLGILQDAGVTIDYFDIILHEPSEERAMTKTNPT